MAISLACASCERKLKVKDELAGRKIKCPGCGAPIGVPREDVVETAAESPRKKPRTVEDDSQDDREEVRPRKKKRKKQSNLALWLGAAVGALLLVGCLIGVVFVVLNFKDKPVDLAKTTPATRKQEKPAPVATAPPNPVQVTCDRWKLRADVANDLSQIVLFYNTAAGDSTSGKVNKDRLNKDIERDAPLIWKELQDGHYVVVWTVVKNPGDNDIVAYEYCMDRKSGLHVVAFGTRRVDDMSTADLEAKLGKKVR